MQNNNLLFLTSHLSRQLIAFSKQMTRGGCDVFIGAPANENLQYFSARHFIRLRKIGRCLLGAKKIKNFQGKIVCFDGPAAAFAKKARRQAAEFLENIGIDLSVWNPKAISGNRQTMLLAQYNIQPHQKMLLAMDFPEKDIKSLIQTIQELGRDDYIIALYGKITHRTARRISRKIENVPQIIYVGKEQDLPSLMRASFAIISLSNKSSFYKIAANAMGRMTAWRQSDIKPNILLKNGVSDVLQKILETPSKQREKFENENIRRAQNYSFEKNMNKLKAMIRE
ncbi:MAG: hypothetical protein LBT45_01490 [Rickettsiales bacterium]|nr:hypothetical protein [Rickettsiales bacterium]